MSFLESLYNRNRINCDRGQILSIMGQLDNPQANLKCILIGGTNGKGSTGAFLNKTLCTAGYKVGFYSSPHILSPNERILLNGKEIPEDKAQFLCERIFEVEKKLKIRLTFFEILTAIAYLYFFENQVDLAILEVGMGGRFDATNIVNPFLSILTNVSLDHTQFLGTSESKILEEKAQIIPENGTVITGIRVPFLLEKLHRICLSKKTDVLLPCDYENRIKNWDLGLKGSFQFENASIAAMACEWLRQKGFKIDEATIKEGFSKTRWPGRYDIIQDKPAILIDCAHNIAGIEVLISSVNSDSKLKVKRPRSWIFGVMADKQITPMLEQIIPASDNLIITQIPDPRAAAFSDIFDQANAVAKASHNEPFIKAIPLISDAIDYGKSASGPDGIVIAAGSIVLAGEVFKQFKDQVNFPGFS